MKTKTKKIIILIILSAGLIISGLIIKATSKTVTLNKPASGRLKIVTTIFPLYDLARTIGGSKVEVSLLLPPGAEAHSFEPQPQDMVKINESDIFIYTGKFMEPWAEDLIKSTSNRNLLIVDASYSIKLRPASLPAAEHGSGSPDPHIWLDFANLQVMLNTIRDSLISRDPANALFYQDSAADYGNKLKNLDDLYRTTLKNCPSQEIVYGGHYAFAYLAQRYNLKYLAAQGLAPDSEPTAKDLINLIEQVKQNKIKYIFYEELTSPKIAATIAQESQAQLLLLNAAHNVTKEQLAQGITLLEIFKNNLINLKLGLGC